MRDDRVAFAALALLGVGAGLLAHAARAEPFRNEALCIDRIDRLDANDDGLVDVQEWPSIADVHRNVDLNGDGRISHDEIMGSCEDGVVEIFENPG